MRSLLALVSGFIFGVALLISGMADPNKVLNFLDVSGTWDPSLALVMFTALCVTTPAFMWAKNKVSLPALGSIDGKLIAGATCFGIGWGLVGLCPGPALVNLASGSADVLLFVASMLAGMGLHHAGKHR